MARRLAEARKISLAYLAPLALSVVLALVSDKAWTVESNGDVRAREVQEALESYAPSIQKTADEIVKGIGSEDDPATREKIAVALLRWAKGEGRPNTVVDGGWPSGFDIAVYNEIIRRFGEDDHPAIRVVLAEALTWKGILISGCGYWQKRENSILETCKAYPEAAIAVFDEVERRFGKDEQPDIRLQYVRSLVAKGWAWNNLDPVKAASVFDDAIRRFGNDPSPTIQRDIIRALLGKADALEQSLNSGVIPSAEVVDAVYDEILQRFEKAPSLTIRLVAIHAFMEKATAWERRLTLGTDIDAAIDRIYYPGKFYQEHPYVKDSIQANRYLKTLRVKCQRHDTQMLLATYDEVERHLKDGHLEDLADLDRSVRRSFEQVSDKCQKPDAQKITAVYDEIDRHFGKDDAPEIRKALALILMKKNQNKWQREDAEVNLATYEDIDRRFGKDDIEIREKIANALLEAGEKYKNVSDNPWWDALEQWFGQDEHFQNRIEMMLFYKARRLTMGKENLEAALSVCDEAERRFGKGVFILLTHQQKIAILGKQGKFDAVLALYDELIRRADLSDKRVVPVLLRQKVGFLQYRFSQQQNTDTREALLIANCDEIGRRALLYPDDYDRLVEECATIRARLSPAQ
jgi:tetratricopeptide (TPR) repeat protein